MSAAPVLLRAEGLVVARQGRPVLDGVGLALRAGEIVALLGPNGAGKSTLLEALAGSLPVAAGRVERHGRVAIAMQAGELARRSVLANVTAALGWWGVPRPERRARAIEALRALSAEALAERPAASLSGGERRRVHLARVLALRAEVLLLDEPFAGLDVETRASLLGDASAALRSPERATLVVVHDRAEAWALADRLLVLLAGRVIAEGAPASVLRAPPSREAARFLGYDGELRDGSEVVLTRPANVRLDPDGPLSARVVRAIPLEDGVRLELALPAGRLYAVAPPPAPGPGDTVRVRLQDGVRFSASPRSPSST